jgi:hypothetical protein
MKLKAKHKAVLASYGRSFLGAAIAAYTIGGLDLNNILIAGLSAVLPVALRALNPNDAAFGRVADDLTKEVVKLAKATKKK